MIVRSRAPLRLDLAGGWTDVAPYASRAGGAVVNAAVSLHAHATVRLGGQGVVIRAADMGAVVSARRVEELRPDGELALLKAAARRLPLPAGFEVETRVGAPAGSGLGGSGALGVAVVAALRAARGEARMPAELAQEAFDIETRDAGVLGGKQDQYAAALGGVQFLEIGEVSVSSTRLTLAEDCLRALETHLVLCYSGASRFSDATHRLVWERYHRGEGEVTRALDGLKACALAMREALAAGDLGAVARTLSDNWRWQQALAPGMQTDDMRRLERAAREAGADGVKALGAGAGGCLVFLARPGLDGAVADALRSAGGAVLPFTFDPRGVAAWEMAER
jgi:D-glycero-alpha-D-manno-heptose-7-phosphate kinase